MAESGYLLICLTFQEVTRLAPLILQTCWLLRKSWHTGMLYVLDNFDASWPSQPRPSWTRSPFRNLSQVLYSKSKVQETAEIEENFHDRMTHQNHQKLSRDPHPFLHAHRSTGPRPSRVDASELAQGPSLPPSPWWPQFGNFASAWSFVPFWDEGSSDKSSAHFKKTCFKDISATSIVSLAVLSRGRIRFMTESSGDWSPIETAVFSCFLSMHSWIPCLQNIGNSNQILALFPIPTLHSNTPQKFSESLGGTVSTSSTPWK